MPDASGNVTPNCEFDPTERGLTLDNSATANLLLLTDNTGVDLANSIALSLASPMKSD